MFCFVLLRDFEIFYVWLCLTFGRKRSTKLPRRYSWPSLYGLMATRLAKLHMFREHKDRTGVNKLQNELRLRENPPAFRLPALCLLYGSGLEECERMEFVDCC